MPFIFEELMTQIANLEKAGDGAWVVVIGCGPRSVECPEPTQPTTQLRKEPIDFNVDPQELGDFLVLKHALNLKIKELEDLEKSFGEEKIKKLNELEKELEGQEIEELSRVFGARAKDRESGKP